MKKEHILRGALFLLMLWGSGDLVALEKPTRDPLGEEAWQAPFGIPKVIYGDDDRIDYYQESDPEKLVWAASTCGLVNQSQLIQHVDTTYSITTSAFTQSGLYACEEEPFGDQPCAPYCTGFMVGEDLIATAGHCYDTSDLVSTYFVFGFWMLDAVTPVTNFSANQVYQGVEVVGFAHSGVYDYSVVRVDRPISAPEAQPFEIRRSGVIPIGTKVGVIGHPSKLPLKLAFGENTVVRSNEDDGFFVANLDTYGGNSGSPVINPLTGMVEGILVRGDTDFLIGANCFYSNTVADSGGRGEDVSKSTTFMEYVPLLISASGVLSLDQRALGCSGSLSIELRDRDLMGAVEALVTVSTDRGESEGMLLTESQESPGFFYGELVVSEASPEPGNGLIEVLEGDVLTVSYADAADAQGVAQRVEESLPIDCSPPEIGNVEVTYLSSSQAAISFSTSEGAEALILYGASCAALTQQKGVSGEALHEVVLNNLEPATIYYFLVQATDDAGNSQAEDNGGACYSFETLSPIDYLTELFTNEDNDLENSTLVLFPSSCADGYTVCLNEASSLPEDPEAGTLLSLADDDSLEIVLENEKHLSFFEVNYDRLYIGSNGFLTFTRADNPYQPLLSTHFNIPRLSALFQDLAPNRGGAVWYEQQEDCVVVSFVGVPEYDSSGAYLSANQNTFQIALFFSGMIRLTWLELYSKSCIVGFSRGFGYPSDYGDSDLSTAEACAALDSDADGLTDVEELDLYDTDPADPDTDGDGLLDGWEVSYALNPNSSAGGDGGAGDPDEDGLVNTAEQSAGTSPHNPDSDGDTLPDGWEALFGLNPLESSAENGGEGDPDGDGLSNTEEHEGGTSPIRADSDWDGVRDAEDENPTGAGVFHSADYEQDWDISMSELLRCIQLYNLFEYHCNPDSEDTYDPGSGDRSCYYHNSDYRERDWKVNLSELLRLIQLFRLSPYQRDVAGEDGFNPQGA